MTITGKGSCKGSTTGSFTITDEAHSHTLTYVEAKKATCEEAGNIGYWTCAGADDSCNTYYTDAEGTTQIHKSLIATPAMGHDWSKWAVTKPVSASADGEETRTCSRCGKKETRIIANPANQMGEDGTPAGPGASAEAAEKAITGMSADSDASGATIAPLLLKSAKQTKASVTISWTKSSKAKKYVIYGNKRGNMMMIIRKRCSVKTASRLKTGPGSSRTAGAPI